MKKSCITGLQWRLKIFLSYHSTFFGSTSTIIVCLVSAFVMGSKQFGQFIVCRLLLTVPTWPMESASPAGLRINEIVGRPKSTRFKA